MKSQPSHVSDAFRTPLVGWKNDSFMEDTVTALTGHMTPPLPPPSLCGCDCVVMGGAAMHASGTGLLFWDVWSACV